MTTPAESDADDSLARRLAAVASLDAAGLEAEVIAVLGRKQGELTRELKAIAALPIEEKRRRGAALNQLKLQFEAAFTARRAALAQVAGDPAATADLTMPGREAWIGTVHPVTAVIDEIVAIFRELGFAVALGPDVENEERNFGALNFPPDHPALDMHDTLFLQDGPSSDSAGGRLLLWTHTSPVQVRVMRAGPPPYRVVIPGLAYRNDPFDA
ncbi:MAG: phenylalanine--tRNA ligase subunit alpha, partial [Gemmatimonadales bacterium]